MRTINAAALAEINKVYGLEPVNIVRVFWNNTFIDYSDKKEGLEDQGVVGKVLEISGLDNIISLDGSSASTSITVKLDDSDGSLRTIINNRDIHKRPVKILQWFTGRPKSDAFVLFSGKINTPIEWSEGERTLSFTVVSDIESYEFGFSLDEGLFQGIPVSAYGQPFPVVFGSVYKVPALLLGESPAGILAQGFAWVFDEQYEAELADLGLKMNQALATMQFLYQTHIGLAVLAASYNDGDIGPSNPDNYDTYLSYKSMSDQAYEQAQQYGQEYLDLLEEYLELQEDYEEKQAYAYKSVRISSQNFPRGIDVVIEINNTRFTARFDGIVMTIGDIVEPPNQPPAKFFFSKLEETEIHKKYVTEQSKEKFRWFDAGSKIRVISVPLYYVACMGTGSTILGVYARRENVRVQVPTSMYEVLNYTFTNEEGQTVGAKIVKMLQPLTTLYDLNNEQLYDSDDIWCDIQGEVPGRYIPILQWTISNFTNLSADAATFATVNVQTVNNPMNFAVLDRKNALEFMKELSVQARTAIWVDDGVVKLRYLPVSPTASVTITPNDVLEDSLVITCDETEQLKTKIIAEWRPSLDQDRPNKVIVRTNVEKYGVLEEEMDYYAYQYVELVRRSATYWGIRWGNTWKKLRLTTHIGKLQLEAQDPVLLSGFNGMFSNGNVTGIVESCNFDSSSLTVKLEIWLPIRWGEMTQYRFAYPANVQELYYDDSEEFRTGNPFEDVEDDLDLFLNPMFNFFNAPPYGIGPYRVDDTPPELSFGTALSDVTINFLRPSGLEDANVRNDYELKEPAELIDPNADAENVDIGTVTGQDPDNPLKYVVTTLDGAERIAYQMSIAEGYQVALNTPVYIVRKKGTWYMQATTWSPE